MIRVKNIDVFGSLRQAHPILLNVIGWLDAAYPDMVVITDGYRKGSKGCHGTEPLRAYDLRSWVFQDPKLIETAINNAWEYDYKRPRKCVAVFHKTDNGAYHFHIQVHPNTRRKQNG